MYIGERQEKLLALMERQKSLLKETREDFQKQIFLKITKLEERIAGEEMELLEKRPSLDRMCKDRRDAKMEEGREKFAATGDVTRTAGSGSRISEMEAEFCLPT